MQSRLDKNEMVKNLIPKFMMGMLIVAVLLIVLLPQRHLWRIGSEKDVIETDALYMFFVDQIGKTHKKAFWQDYFH